VDKHKQSNLTTHLPRRQDCIADTSPNNCTEPGDNPEYIFTSNNVICDDNQSLPSLKKLRQAVRTEIA